MRFPKMTDRDGIEKKFKGRYVNASLRIGMGSDRKIAMLIEKASEYPAKQLDFLGPVKRPRNGCCVRFRSLDLYEPPELVIMFGEEAVCSGTLTYNQLSPVLFQLYEKALEWRDGGPQISADAELSQWISEYFSLLHEDMTTEDNFERRRSQLSQTEARFYFAFSIVNKIFTVREQLRILQCLANRYSAECEHADPSRKAWGAEQQVGEYGLLMRAFYVRSVPYWNWRHHQKKNAQGRKFSEADDQEFAARIQQLKAENPGKPLYWCAEQLQAQLHLEERESTSPLRLLDRTRMLRARLKRRR